MKVESVTIKNFRGICNELRLEFGNNKVILLTAPNGLGKTTILDAIEWALTGSIGRLRESYRIRGHNKKEQEKNVSGILRNENASPDAVTEVTLKMTGMNGSFEIKRWTEQDQLDETFCQFSNLEYVDGKEFAQRFLKEIENNSFYEYHFCDIQKAISFQSKKRSDVSNMFSDFARKYDKEETWAKNLEVFEIDAKRYIGDIDEQLARYDIEINQSEKELIKLEQNLVIDQYPDIIIFANETVNVDGLKTEDLAILKKNLYKAGYAQIFASLAKLDKQQKVLSNIDSFTTLKAIVETNFDSIEQVIKGGGKKKLCLKMAEVEECVSKYSAIKLDIDTLPEDIIELYDLNNPEITREKYEEFEEHISLTRKQIDSLDSEIKTVAEGNEIIDLLTDLVGKRRQIIALRDKELVEGKAQCPVCGSTDFGIIKDEEILLHAQSYLDESGKLVSKKKETKQFLLRQIDDGYEEYIKNLRGILEESLQTFKKKLQKLKDLYNKTKDFFDYVAPFEGKYDITDLADIQYISSLIEQFKKQLISEEERIRLEETYAELLTFLEGNYDKSESIDQILNKVKIKVDGIVLTEYYTDDLLKKKIDIVNCLLRNQESILVRNKLNELRKNKEALEEKKKDYDNLHKAAKKKRKEILALINSLKTSEYIAIGPLLKKLYKKLIRIDNTDDFALDTSDNDKISIIDDKGKNIVNILSNGQLSAFMLAYFFAGIITRGNNEICKIYFFDDLSVCLDDINMLSLLDLIKYQMCKEQGMEQLFFALCDENVSKLLKYKLRGSRIPFCEIVEGAYGFGKVDCPLVVKAGYEG